MTGNSSSLRSWQVQALNAWVQNGFRGIVAAATGTGKTRLALEAVRRAGPDRVVIVVPTTVLQEQWASEVRRALHLPKSKIGKLGGQSPSFRFENEITIAVINSARERLAGVLQHWHSEGLDVLLVVDECHWAGSAQASSLFAEGTRYTLGLSATPERGDDGFEEIVVPSLGDVVFRYPLRAAVEDGVLSEIVSTHVLFGLTDLEKRTSEQLTARITALRYELNVTHPDLGTGPGWEQRLHRIAEADSTARLLQRLLDERRLNIRSAQGRLDSFAQLAESSYLSGRHTLVFNETIAQAESVAALLRTLGKPFALEHSNLPEAQRKAALSRFAAKAVPILVAVRALDEGVDIPEANCAVIVSGSLNQRQRVQRIGRIARISESDAEVISLIGRGSAEEFETLLLDQHLLGESRVRQLEVSSFS